ncbi:MAG: tetratricopeptide repeat protein [Candidatus Sumerlaeaceae bacterium]
MDLAIAQEFLDEVNAKADAGELLKRIGYANDKIQVVGDAIKAFCPIHKDKKFRSLLIESGKQSFKCTLKTCAGAQGGTLVELYALARKMEPLLAGAELVGALDLAIDPEWTSQIAAAMLEEAQQAFVRREPELAESAARRALKFQPTLADARLLLATMFAERGEMAQAVDEYAALVEGYLSASQYEEADQTLESAIAAFPDSEDLLFLQVRSAEQQNQTDRAVELLNEIVGRREATNRQMDNVGVLQKILELRADNADAHVKLSEIYEQRHDMRTAGKELEIAARLLKEQGRNADAIPLLERVVKLAPEMAKTRLDLAEELIRDGDYARAKEQIFEIANQQIENQNFAAAELTARRWLEVEPESFEVHETLARIYMDQDRQSEAGVELKQAAEFSLKHGESERAMQFFFRVKFVAPENLEVRRQIISLFEQQGETERAGFELLDLAEVLLGQSNPEEAEQALTRAADITDSRDVKQQVADTLLSHGRNDAAEQLLRQIISEAEADADLAAVADASSTLLQILPDDVSLAFRRCMCLWECDPDRALEETGRVVGDLLQAGERESAVDLLRKGAAYASEYCEESLDCLRQALGVQDAESAGKFYSAVIHTVAEEDTEAALQLAREMTALDPSHATALADCGVLFANVGMTHDSAEAYVQLAKISESTGDRELALQHLEDALSQEPEHLTALQRRAELALAHTDADSARSYFQAFVDVLQVRGSEDELRSGLRTYLEYYPDDLAVQMQLASLLVQAGEEQNALEMYLRIAEHASTTEAVSLQVNSLQNAVGIAGRDAAIRQRLGKALKLHGQAQAAAIELLEAARLLCESGSLSQARTAAAESAESADDPLQALELLCTIDEEMNDPELLAEDLPQLIAQLRSAGRVHQALERANRLLQLKPGLVSQRIVADLRAENGDTDEALKEYTLLAQQYEEQKDYPEALAIHAEMAQLRAPNLDTLHRLVRLAEKTSPEAAASAKLQLGQALLASGDVLGAFETARTLGKQNTGVLAAAMLLQKIGRAAGTLEQALEAFLAAAEAYATFPEKSEAKIECLEAALALDPENTAAHQMLAEHYEAAGEADFAFSHRVALLPVAAGSKKQNAWKQELAKLRVLAADDPGKHLELGRRALRSEQVAYALEDFEKAAELGAAAGDDPVVLESADAAEALVFNSVVLCRAKFDVLLSSGDKEVAKVWLRECAQQALRSDKASEAEDYAQRWIELDRADADALELLAAAYQKQNRTQKAVDTYIALANLLKFAGDYERSIAILRQCLAVDDQSVPARQLHWQVLLEADKQNEALQEMHQLADLLIERQSYRDACTLLSRILDYRTNSEQTLERLASLVHEHEGFAKASPYFRKLIQLKSATLPADQMAAEYERILKLEGVDAEFRREYADFLKAQGLLPDAKEQYLHTAQVYRDELNSPEKAVELFILAVELLPESGDSPIYEEVARLHQASGNLEDAVAALRKASRQYIAAGESKKAVQSIRRALEIDIGQDRAADEALLAHALVAAGEKKKAKEAFNQAFIKAQSPDSSLPESVQREVYTTLLAADPLHVESALALLALLPTGDVAPSALETLGAFKEAGRHEDQIRILKAARSAAPADIQIRQELVGLYRSRGDTAKLQYELADLVRTASAAKQHDHAREALEELTCLPPSADLKLQVAPLYFQLEDEEQAVAAYCSAAELFEEAGQSDDAVDALRHALQINGNSVPAALVASLARKGGAEVRKIARDILEAALIARTRTRSLVLAVALLEREPLEEAKRLLSMVFMRGGAGFVAAIAGTHADWLLEAGRSDDTAGVVTFITQLAPNSPDVWWLASQLRKRCGDKAGSAEAALKAAQLYNEAGAVSEEESCYRDVLDEIPEDAATLQTLAFFYEREKRGEEGIEVMRRLAAIAHNAGDVTGGLSWLRKALDLGPSQDELRAQYAELLQVAGKSDQALEQWLEVARRSAKTGIPDRAVHAYQKVLQLEPENEHALSFLLDAATRAGDEAEVRRLSLILAEIKAETGAVMQACQLLKNLVQKDPGNIEALEKLSAFSLLAHDEEGHRVAALNLGNRLVKRGDYLRAMEQLESALEYDTSNLEILQTLIDCCAAEGILDRGASFAMRMLQAAKAAGQPERVRQAASTILGYDEQHTIARRELAEALLCMNRLPDAIAEWQRAAEQLVSDKNPAYALECYRRIVQVSPSHIQAWRKLGDLSLLTGDSDAARGAYLHLLEVYSQSGEIEKADAMIARMLQLDPEDAELHQEALDAYRRTGRNEHAMEQVLWLVRDAMAADDHEEAERLIDLGNAIAPDSLALQQCQLEVIRKLGRTDELQLRLRELADKMLHAGELQRAADVLEQMRDADPENIELRKEIASTRMQLGEIPPAIAEYAYVLRELIQRQETEEARSTADQIAAQYADVLELRARIGEVFAQNGMADVGSRHYMACAELAYSAEDPLAQLHFLRLAVDARPRWAEGYEKLAEAALAADDTQAADTAYGSLAELLIEARKFPQAAATLRTQISLFPKHELPRARLVDLYERTGDRENEAVALRELADLYIAGGMMDEAVESYKRLVTLRPDDPKTLQRYIEHFAQVGNELEIVGEYLRLAQAYAASGKLQEAIQTFEQVASIDRKNPEIHEKFAALLLTNGQKGRALAELRKLADIYQQKGEMDAAVEVLHAGLALDPENAELCLTLASGQQKCGLRDEAQTSYARASNILSGTTAVKAMDVYRGMLAHDEENTEIRRRLCDLLVESGEPADAAAHARKLAEIHCGRGEMDDAEDAYRIASELQPESVDALMQEIQKHARDPFLQYLAYIRLGNRLFEDGDIDRALDTYRTARSLNDERPQTIQKCVDCVSLIAPEAEAIPDYIALAERYMVAGDPARARKVYEHIARLDPFNADAGRGLVAAVQAENGARSVHKADTRHDRQVLGRRERKKRVGLEELLSACKDAAAQERH